MKKPVPKILHLNLHREFFAAIAARTKRIEYRERTPYWQKRLEGRQYDVIQFRHHGAGDVGRVRRREKNQEMGRTVLRYPAWPSFKPQTLEAMMNLAGLLATQPTNQL